MSQSPLKIGISCFPTYGGSGVIATELGLGLARRGHQVHFISYELPHRLDRFAENTFFHEVEVSEYPLFTNPPYPLSLASKMVEVITYQKLDLLHVHYAIPHATSAYLAKQIMGDKAPKVITTLHGTDITLVGNKRDYLPITRFSITESDAVTAPSRYLKDATYSKLNISADLPIEVIPNFVNTEKFKPSEETGKQKIPRCVVPFAPGDKILVHTSNFRPVKRLLDIIKIFAGVREHIPSHLILIGDGPDRSAAENLVRDLKLTEYVCFLGKQDDFRLILQNADVFLLPSETESFGLAALEAMSCGVPVITTNVGGLPEVVIHGVTGYLSPVGAIEDMVKNTIEILSNDYLHTQMSLASRKRSVEMFNQESVITAYEKFYYKVLNSKLA